MKHEVRRFIALAGWLAAALTTAQAWTLQHPAGFTVDVPDGWDTVADARHLHLIGDREHPSGVIFQWMPGVRNAADAVVAVNEWAKTTFLFSEFTLREGELRTRDDVPGAAFQAGSILVRTSFDVFQTLTVQVFFRFTDEGAFLGISYNAKGAAQHRTSFTVARTSRLSAESKLPAGEWWGPGGFSFKLPEGTTVETRDASPGILVLKSSDSQVQPLLVFTVPEGARTREALVAAAKLLPATMITDLKSVKGSATAPDGGGPLFLEAAGRARIPMSDRELTAAAVRFGLVSANGQTLAALGATYAHFKPDARAQKFAATVDLILKSARWRAAPPSP